MKTVVYIPVIGNMRLLWKPSLASIFVKIAEKAGWSDTNVHHLKITNRWDLVRDVRDKSKRQHSSCREKLRLFDPSRALSLRMTVLFNSLACGQTKMRVHESWVPRFGWEFCSTLMPAVKMKMRVHARRWNNQIWIIVLFNSLACGQAKMRVHEKSEWPDLISIKTHLFEVALFKTLWHLILLMF